MPSEDDLVTTERGSVIAPAGCGKTELIARAASINRGKRILILTHTNAGLRALRDRMRRLGVNAGGAHVDTIAGWALSYAVSYPVTSKHANHDPVQDEWDAVYRGVTGLLDVSALRSVIGASYSRLLVDEYQDCSRLQHDLVRRLAGILPTCVLGDPLQGIFDFGDGLVSWSDVTAEFPSMGELSTPWRWSGKNEPLGAWCLELREALLGGKTIDLRKAPVAWKKSDQFSPRNEAYRVAGLEGGVVVIRKWEAQAHDFARTMGGRYRSMEEVEGKALRTFASELDSLNGPARAARIVELATTCLTGIKAEIGTAAKALENGNVPTPNQSKKHADVVKALVAVCHDNSVASAYAAMDALEKLPGCTRFRSELWGSAKKALKEHATNGRARLVDTAVAIRQQHRAAGRVVDPRLVSRTLLVKGLEFDHALVPKAEEFEGKRPGDGARHFYVAATRASRSLTVLSVNSVVKFAVPSL
jgi:DNA helicase-2/ATP-dependent DNA helicase PcrA